MMAEHRLNRRVEEVAGRLQRLRQIRRRARTWGALSVFGLGLLAANSLLATPLLPPAMTVAAGVLLLTLGGLAAYRERCSSAEAAAAVEQRYPDLDSRLMTAIGQRPNIDEGGFSYLQHAVISEALLHAQRNDWRDAVPARSLAGATLRQSFALVMFCAAFAAAAVSARRPDMPGVAGNGASSAGDAAADVYGLTIEPGDVQLERGTSLLVLARFGGQTPSAVSLVTNLADGTRVELPLSKSLEDPLFGGRVAQVRQDLTYHVVYDGVASAQHRVSVFDYPELQRADATITSPEYTGLAVTTIEDVRRVSVVEGARLTLICRLNKPVAIARLFANDGTDYELVTDDLDPRIVSVTWQPAERQTLTLELVDAEQRKNKEPPQFVVEVIPNRPPEVTVAFPGRDLRVSPLQELPLQAELRDDFGLTGYGLVYQRPDGVEQTLPLGGEAAAESKVDLAHELSFEELAAQPNELVSYYFYAEDVGPDGSARRTMSNMFFAEVRHFDEVFRQVEGTGQASGSGSPSTELLKLQRDIVTANWNLVRREQGEPSAALPEEAGVIADSQATALELAGEMRGAEEDLLSRQYLTEAMDHMQSGEAALREAATLPAVEPLHVARTSTQAAYSALLKLQAREHLVKQSQSGKSSPGESQQQLNDQLNQLELKNNPNRYETESQETTASNREALQVLNRLRELARRQGDLNDRIQELENELRAASSAAEREEIQRQLKRLQDEQQQLVRDLDEVKERMERPENRSQMTDARQQLDKTREHLRNTQESLQSGQVSKALSEGSRAQRELDDLKKQFRDQTANQFAESMRALRDEARQLAEAEEELSQQFDGGKSKHSDQERQGDRPTLRDETKDGPNLQEAVTAQSQRLEQVLQSAEEIVHQSEATEPLLSKKLYDALRKTRVDQPGEALALSTQFLRLGLKREAAEAEAQAGRGIEALRDGIEQAAEAVLGNEVASLERARDELDRLAQAIAGELAQAEPPRDTRQQPAAGRPSDQASENRPDGAEGQPAREGQTTERSENPEPSNLKMSSKPAGDDATNQPAAGERPPGSGTSARSPSAEATAGESAPQEAVGGNPPSKAASGQSPATGQASSGQPADQPAPGKALSSFLQAEGRQGGGSSGPHLGPAGPLTTAEFVQWSDRMRDVEEMLDDPSLRADVARIRDQAREMRIDVKRHGKEPDWALVRLTIYGPMLELQDRLAEEIARRDPEGDEIVPLDRDPVPDRYAELVRQYYERLGSSR